MIAAIVPLLFSLAAPAAGHADLGGCVPMRWDSADPATLRLLEGSPVNCLLLDAPYWNPDLIRAAQAAGLRVLPVVESATHTERALALRPDGLVLTGTVEAPAAGLPFVRLAPRHALTFTAPVEGTAQGLWPGIRVEKEGSTVALPTGAPWIETNSGFLRFVRTSQPAAATFWMAVRPPEGEILRGRHYVQALADAAFSGAVWVLALDSDFRKGLFSGDERYLKEWQELVQGWKFLVGVQDYGRWPDHGLLALIQDAGSGGLFSGGFADMLAARHIPVKITLPPGIAGTTKESTQVLLNVDPAAEGSDRKKLLLELAKKGITIVNSPMAWNPGKPGAENFLFPEKEVKDLSDAWREINSMLGRRNFGLRVFGAPGALSQLKISPDGKQVVVTLLNYSDYAIRDLSLHLTGKFTKATLLTRAGSITPALFPSEEGLEIDIEQLADVAILVVE